MVMKVFTKIINMQHAGHACWKNFKRGILSLLFIVFSWSIFSKCSWKSVILHLPFIPLLGLQSLPWLKFSIISILLKLTFSEKKMLFKMENLRFSSKQTENIILKSVLPHLLLLPTHNLWKDKKITRQH